MGQVSPKLVLSDRQQKAVLDATFALDELQRHAFLGSLTIALRSVTGSCSGFCGSCSERTSIFPLRPTL